MKCVVIEQCAPFSLGIVCLVDQFANLEILYLMCLPHIFHCAQYLVHTMENYLLQIVLNLLVFYQALG
jgi:hypothetical protein